MNGIIRLVKLERSSTPLHEQVAAELRRAIADGETVVGDRLPPARDLAAVLGVNTNTVLRALRVLRSEDLLEFRRGRGVTVIATPGASTLLRKALELVQLAKENGYHRSELVQVIDDISQGHLID